MFNFLSSNAMKKYERNYCKNNSSEHFEHMNGF